jgi:hypothetical protein
MPIIRLFIPSEMWSRNEVVRINLEAFWSQSPGFTDHPEGSSPSQRLQMSGKVVGRNKGQRMGFQCVPIWIVEGLDRGLFYRAIHALDLAVSPRVVRLGQSVIDTVLIADTIKDMPTETVSSPVSVSGLLSKRSSVISQRRMDFVRKGINDFPQKSCAIAFRRGIEKAT